MQHLGLNCFHDLEFWTAKKVEVQTLSDQTCPVDEQPVSERILSDCLPVRLM